MTRWIMTSRTETASYSFRFYYSPNDGHWRTSENAASNPNSSWGVIQNGATQHAFNAWSTCYFTDGTYNNYQDLGDKNTGMQLLVWNGAMGTRGARASLP